MQSALHSVVGPKEVKPDNLVGRTAIVTGGASGIGFEISRALANAGCKVVLVSLKEEHGTEALSKIKKESPDADVEWKECNTGDLKQVRKVFTELNESLDRLNFLVLCAGINGTQYETDIDGIEQVFGVNYLGQYYATNLVWPLIRKTSLLPGVLAPRVVLVSSELHRAAPSNTKFANVDEINDSSISPPQLYGRSKLAQILFAKYGLLERVIKPSSDSIYALSVHPGTVSTDIQHQWKDAYPGVTGKLLTWAMQAVGRDAEQGSYGALWALTSPEVSEKNQNGYYYTDPGKAVKESSQASDSALGTALWELSENLIKEKLGQDALLDWASSGSN